MSDGNLPFEVDVQSVKQMLDDGQIVLLDCREQDEYDHVNIAGSKLIPMSEIQQRVNELEPHKTEHLVVHCHHGGRSQRVTMWLRQQGYDRVQNMTGGIDAWSQIVDADLPRY